MNAKFVKQMHLVVFLSLLNTFAIGAMVINKMMPTTPDTVVASADKEAFDSFYYLSPHL